MQRELRGVWVASVANIDWPSEPGLSQDVQKEEADRILDVAVSVGLNAVFLQVRPHGDALYKSSLEPWSSYLTGVQGQHPGYDPLAYWVRGAHARGLELHAWLNPFRVGHPADPSELAGDHIASTHPGLVVAHGDYLWLDPSKRAAREHSLRVARDILSRYDIDGLHLDDYFYPYPVEGSGFDDEDSYAAYLKSGGGLDTAAWRREHINGFVQELSLLVRKTRPEAAFGISPFGIWRPGHPEGVVGFDAYEQLAADARLWLRAGWIDYAAPQLYWPIASEGQPFEDLLGWWQGENQRGRGIWPGLYLTRIKHDDGWAPDEILNQIRATREAGAPGFVLFSMVGLLENRQQIAERLFAEALSEPTVPPANWRVRHGSPVRADTRITSGATRTTLRMRVASESSKPRLWVLHTRDGYGWHTRVLPGSVRVHDLPATDRIRRPDAVVLKAIGRDRVLTPVAAWVSP